MKSTCHRFYQKLWRILYQRKAFVFLFIYLLLQVSSFAHVTRQKYRVVTCSEITIQTNPHVLHMYQNKNSKKWKSNPVLLVWGRGQGWPYVCSWRTPWAICWEWPPPAWRIFLRNKVLLYEERWILWRTMTSSRRGIEELDLWHLWELVICWWNLDVRWINRPRPGPSSRQLLD